MSFEQDVEKLRYSREQARVNVAMSISDWSHEGLPSRWRVVDNRKKYIEKRMKKEGLL